MAPLKVVCVFLLIVASCVAAPGYRRGSDNGENGAGAPHAEHETLSTQDSPQDISESAQDAILPSNRQLDRDQETSLRELLRSKILSHPAYKGAFRVGGGDLGGDSFEEEPPLLPPAPLPPQQEGGDADQPPVLLGSIVGDPYEKLLESFIQAFMSRVLKAEIKEVRVEEMEKNQKRKKI